MSRHSKWSKIKHEKGSADQKRGALFTKLSRNVTVAAREGGDPSMNFKLRLAMDRARVAGMPKDTVDRAVAKGSGADKEGIILTEETYEGFGPGKIVYMVETVADNKNRAYQSLRKTFSDYGGNLGNQGSVGWMFEHKGIIRLDLPHPASGAPLPQGEGRVRADQDLELQLIDAGAEDIEKDEEGITVYTKPDQLKAVEEKIRALGIDPMDVGLEWVAKEKKSVDETTKEKLETFENALDGLEDVSEYYNNIL